ncbi:MAG: terminase small subunit [Enterococcus sp.]|nr:terminase small subunit [Enterococcus sp.]
MEKKDAKVYVDFLKNVGFTKFNDINVTNTGYPLSVKESKFIDMFVGTGDIYSAIRESGLGNLRNLAGKDYIVEEIRYRLDLLKKETIADADEIMQYFTKVMRGEEKDQFGLDAPLSERTRAAQELAKRIIDIEKVDTEVPEIKVTLNFEGF